MDCKPSVEILNEVHKNNRAAFKQRWIAYKDVSEIIAKVINRKLQEAENSSKNDYNNPAWAYFAADREGYKRALKEILNNILP